MTASTSLRILMTADAVGGVWQYATELSAALAAHGHEIVLAVLGPNPSPAQSREAGQIAGVTLVETELPLDWLCIGPEPVREAAAELARLARDEAVDVVHCNMPTLAGVARFPAPLVAVTHGCVATWWQAAKDEPLAPAYRWHREMMRQGLAAADAVVAPSAGYAATVKRLYQAPSLPLVVHNGRRPSPAPITETPPLNAALTVGRQWDRVKNAELLDAVASRLDMPFLAAGALRGPHGEEISLAHLQPLGQLESDALAALLALRPVYVSAASFEPFGLATLEAASAGCALVLSDIPTFRELWDGAALFVDPGDAESFTKAIERLVGNPAERARLSKAAARRAQRYSPAAMADGMVPIYGKLIGREEVAA